ncbi:YfbM family protein [Aeromonas enteropelogenes]|uniref:DUF1877 domain-containing protein n=1 Tax=Aeromonas enteropelogenes TaxID=29489 RepID=A0A175VHD6_AEREN|nr:YfbM family protein [Aeromonas enteropelogenes]KXU80135.1 hypothetical protein LCR_13625 [Aeromonas enteropelogenes]
MSMIGNYLKLSTEQLEEIVSDPAKAEELVYPDDANYPTEALDINKAWHLIHFLLNGETWGGEGALSNAVLGGHELPETDAGYGPFRYLQASEVKQTSLALAEVSSSDLWSRFDAKKVTAAEIYPTPWAGDDGDRDYILQNFEALKQYFAEAADSGNAMLLYLS